MPYDYLRWNIHTIRKIIINRHLVPPYCNIEMNLYHHILGRQWHNIARSYNGRQHFLETKSVLSGSYMFCRTFSSTRGILKSKVASSILNCNKFLITYRSIKYHFYILPFTKNSISKPWRLVSPSETNSKSSEFPLDTISLGVDGPLKKPTIGEFLSGPS